MEISSANTLNPFLENAPLEIRIDPPGVPPRTFFQTVTQPTTPEVNDPVTPF